MNKTLLTATLEKVRKVPHGEACSLSPEEAGVLKAFLDMRKGATNVTAPEKELHEKIADVLKRWPGVAPESSGPEAIDVEDKRTQLALREAIDKAQSESFDTLTGDEVRLMKGSYEALMTKSPMARKKNERLLHLLGEAIAKYEKFNHSKGGRKSAEAPTLDSLDDEFLGSDKDQSMRNNPKYREDAAPLFHEAVLKTRNRLDTIEVDLNVRIVERNGQTSIHGSLPADTLLVVRNGGVYVDGLVTGNILSEGDVVINGNVQGGWIVSTKGDVLAQRILLGSKVISKSGSVVCEQMESPDCVFAWRKVLVKGSILGGKVYGGAIEVGSKVKSVEMQTCGEIQVERVEGTGRHPSAICLRKTMDCEIYDAVMEPNMLKMQKELKECNTTIETATRMTRFTQSIIHSCYRTALFYMLGGAESGTTALVFHENQIITVNLAPIVAIAESVMEYYRPFTEKFEYIDEHEAEAFTTDSFKSISYIRESVESMPQDFGTRYKSILMGACNYLASHTKKLLKALLTRESAVKPWGNFLIDYDKWRQELGERRRKTKDLANKFGIDQQIIEQMENDPGSLKDMLDETLKDALKLKGGENCRRANSPLIRLLKTTAGRSRKGIKKWQDKMDEAHSTIKDNIQKLTESHCVMFADETPGKCAIHSHHFDSGVVVTARPGHETGFDTKVAEVIVLGNDIESWTSFVLQDRMVRRMDDDATDA